jgi:hypothetical protein
MVTPPTFNISFSGTADNVFSLSGIAQGQIGSWGYFTPSEGEEARAKEAAFYEKYQNATTRTVGRGEQVRMTVTREEALALAEYFADMGESFLGGSSDPEARADGRACLKAAEQIRNQVQA